MLNQLVEKRKQLQLNEKNSEICAKPKQIEEVPNRLTAHDIKVFFFNGNAFSRTYSFSNEIKCIHQMNYN